MAPRSRLQQYEQAFRENAIDDAVLPELTADDLKDLGVSLVGHRRKLFAAIAALRSESGSEPREEAGDVADTSVAERRHLSIMFSDLVGSTGLSTRYDPEDLREIFGAYHSCVADTVARFDGFVAKHMGDGVLVYFGYPNAHEDDAERAVRPGLAVIDAVDRPDTPERLQVRLGVASGLAVVGDLIGVGAAPERGVIGKTPNLAARLQTLATPGTLVISEATRRQIGAWFEMENLGPQPLAGCYPLLPDSQLSPRHHAKFGSMAPLPPPAARAAETRDPSSVCGISVDLLSTRERPAVTPCSQALLGDGWDRRKWTNKEARNCGHMARITARLLAGYANLLGMPLARSTPGNSRSRGAA